MSDDENRNAVIQDRRDDLERVARAMWSATRVSPTLPSPLPFDELGEYHFGELTPA
jgi:hypothetical protein